MLNLILPPSFLSAVEGMSRLLADCLCESMYPRLEAGTREALERGVEATLPGDEGHAAWQQYREIKVWKTGGSCCSYFGVLAIYAHVMVL